MLRSILLNLSRAAWARRIVTGWPLARRIARRFVAGETEDDAVIAIRTLNAAGIRATVDVLGESTTDAQEARRARDAYLHLIGRLHDEHLDSSVSVKLTALGLDVEADLCRDNLRTILTAARERAIRVTIDMEDHSYTDRTLETIRALRAEGFENCQGVIQACLYRSPQDIGALTGVDVRLCKGAYREPAHVAYPRKADVDQAYARLMRVLLDATLAGAGFPGLATHDQGLIEQARAYVEARGIARDRFEFQMLYGIRGDLQKRLVAEGYGLRVYVPFGTQWYPYVMRRLAERPANLWFFVSNLLRG